MLRRLMGTRSLATEMTAKQLDKYYSDKAPVPDSPESLYELMQHGGGLDREFNNPLYRDKLEGIELEIIRSWVETLCSSGKITKIDGTGVPEIDGKWFNPFMAEIHGTLACLASSGSEGSSTYVIMISKVFPSRLQPNLMAQHRQTGRQSCRRPARSIACKNLGSAWFRRSKNNRNAS